MLRFPTPDARTSCSPVASAAVLHGRCRPSSKLRRCTSSPESRSSASLLRPPCRHAAAPPASTSPLAVAAPCRSSASSALRRPNRLRRRTAAPSVVPIDRRPPRPAFCLPWPTIYSASRTLGGSFLDHHDLGIIPAPMAARAPRCGCLEGVLKLHRRAACLPCLFPFHEPCR